MSQVAAGQTQGTTVPSGLDLGLAEAWMSQTLSDAPCATRRQIEQLRSVVSGLIAPHGVEGH